jgi:hypothetical protein
LISTRGNFDINTSLLLANHNETDYAAFDIPGLQVGKCPDEIAIYVHGWEQVKPMLQSKLRE